MMNIKKSLNVLMIISIAVFLGSCTLKKPLIKEYQPLDTFEYFITPETASKKSSGGSLYGNNSGIYGNSYSQEVNPSSLVQGTLMKKGYTSLTELDEQLLDKTLIVQFGESGKRNIAGGLVGYTLEVTISFIAAKSKKTVYVCTAEGFGLTESSDIRQAIDRCLSDFPSRTN